jgi:hypothetical protein
MGAGPNQFEPWEFTHLGAECRWHDCEVHRIKTPPPPSAHVKREQDARGLTSPKETWGPIVPWPEYLRSHARQSAACDDREGHDPRWFELSEAACAELKSLADARYRRNRAKGNPENKVDEQATDFMIDYLSLRASYAMCRWLGVPFVEQPNRAHVLPTRPSVEVRSTLHRYGSLIFGPRRPEIRGDVIVLCVERVMQPRIVGAVGWIAREEFVAKCERKKLRHAELRALSLYALHVMTSFPLSPDAVERALPRADDRLRSTEAHAAALRDQALVAAACRLFNGEVVAVRPRGALACGEWPKLVDLGPPRAQALTPCMDCHAGTWVLYDTAPLCRPCAMARWAAWQRDRGTSDGVR